MIATTSNSLFSVRRPLPARWMRTHLLAVIFMLILSGAAAPVNGQENYTVTGVAMRGNRTFSDDVLRKQVAVHGRSTFLGIFPRGEEFLYGAETLAQDVKRLRRFYQQEGFLNASVRHALYDVKDAEQRLAVRFDIEEGEPVLVRGVRRSVTRHDSGMPESHSQVDSLLRAVDGERRLVAGTRFRDGAALADRALYIEHLADRGYPYAGVEPVLDVDTTAMRVDLTWRIDPGPLCVFGDLTVQGNDDVPSGAIVKQLAFAPGDLFDQSLLSRSQDRIYGLGLFRVVTVVAELDSAESARVPVKINIVESPRISSEFGVGYGREEEFRVHNHSVFFGVFGATRRLDLDLLHSALEPYHAELAWTRPAFLTPLTRITLSPFVRRQTEPGFTLNRYGGTVELVHRFTRHVDGSISYLFERVKLEESSISTEDLSEQGLDLLYNKSSITVGLISDWSSPVLSPTSGIWTSASVQASGLGLGSEYHFYKVLLELRRYQSLGGFVLSSRVKWGGIKSMDDDRFVPVEERLFSGGSRSVRGWPRAELGPIVNGVPLGGKALLEGAVELRHLLFWKISGAVFVDAGNVWKENGDISLSDIRYSAGTGLRYGTPIGPIRVDFARPVQDERTSWMVHLSVGQAF